MEFKKKDIDEIIDSNSDLIGANGIPTNGPNKETQASKTTDYNYKVGTQPFRYDMLGRFGFTMMPFLEESEGGEDDNTRNELVNEIGRIIYLNEFKTIENYFRNPNKLKSDFRKLSESDYESLPTEIKSKILEVASEVMVSIQPYFEQIMDKIQPHLKDSEEQINEDVMVKGNPETEMTEKTEDKGVRTNKIEKIAGLINSKLNQKELDNLMNLLEKKNG